MEELTEGGGRAAPGTGGGSGMAAPGTGGGTGMADGTGGGIGMATELLGISCGYGITPPNYGTGGKTLPAKDGTGGIDPFFSSPLICTTFIFVPSSSG